MHVRRCIRESIAPFVMNEECLLFLEMGHQEYRANFQKCSEYSQNLNHKPFKVRINQSFNLNPGVNSFFFLIK